MAVLNRIRTFKFDAEQSPGFTGKLQKHLLNVEFQVPHAPPRRSFFRKSKSFNLGGIARTVLSGPFSVLPG